MKSNNINFTICCSFLGALSGRGTKIALVLIQRKEMSPTAVASDENSASERATGQKLLLVFTGFLS